MAAKDAAAAPHYHGHRQRLKDRFRQTGGEAFPDYEFLELLLFSVIPRRDTKPLAKTLVAAFGSFDAAINADQDKLAAMPGVGPAIIAQFELIRLVKTQLLDSVDGRRRPQLNSSDRLLQYCRQSPDAPDQGLRVLFLDNRNRLIVEERIEQARQGKLAAPTPIVARRALANSASAVILVQHCPCDVPDLTHVDRASAIHARDALQRLGIALHDYLLMGAKEYVSLRTIGEI